MKKYLPIIFSAAILLVVFVVVLLVRNHRSSDSGTASNGAENSAGQVAQDGSAVDQGSASSGVDGQSDSHSNAAHSKNASGSAGADSEGSTNNSAQSAGSGMAGGVANSKNPLLGGVNSQIGDVAMAPNAASANGVLKNGVATGQAVGAVPGASGSAVVQDPNGPIITKIPVPSNVPSCARITFQNQDKEFKVKRHELTLTQKIASKKEVCVTVNGEGVTFDLQQKGSKIVFDFRMKSRGDVVATYCMTGACKLSCPKPKKDFFDEISGESSDEVINGFAGSESAEEKQLQRELASLQKLLKEPNDKRKIIEWNEGARNEGPCNQIVQVSKF